ncbi:MAG: MAPEG family protein [Candidatus Dadabacteria bacterium]|nr:MAG: MAPEG family protein [Candidatus Dadabacteria bacterium]
MTPTAWSLLGFVAWTLFLMLGIVSTRSVMVLSGKRAANDFPADRPHDGPPLYQRLLRAHLNCVENLPLFAAVTLLAISIEVTGLTDGPAQLYLGARILQSLTHLIGTSALLVQVRFAFFLVQIGALLTMIVRLAN